jgi:hypothetical protein
MQDSCEKGWLYVCRFLAEKGANVEIELDLTVDCHLWGQNGLRGPNVLVGILQIIRLRGLYLTGIRMFTRCRGECAVDVCVPRMILRHCAPLCCVLCLGLKCSSICLYNPDV